jgi:oligopeptide/dipeptide ABC transporter ATP-binding protein
VQSVADSIAVMYAGRVVETGPAATVLAAPAHPYTRALLAARPVGGGSDVVLTPISGAQPGLSDRPAGCPFHPRCAIWDGREPCEAEPPALRPVNGAAHAAACHFAEEMMA